MLARVLLLFVFLPSLAYSLQCYRCFGSGFCNDLDADTSLAHVDNCSQVLSYNGNDVHVKRLMDAVKKLTSGSASTFNSAPPGCLTATVHESSYDHTLRLCVANASIICQAIQEVLFPQYHDYEAVGFSCAACSSDLCNRQTQGSAGNALYYSVHLLIVLGVVKLAF